MLETKLLTGSSGYDVVAPSGALTYRLIQAGALQKPDKSKLGNLGKLDPQIMQLVAANDPGNEHAVPYLRGMTGIAYNPDMVEKVLGTRTIDSLSAIFDPASASRLAACGVTWLDSPADMFQLAFIYLGLDANSHRPEDLAAAEALLTRAAARPSLPLVAVPERSRERRGLSLRRLERWNRAGASPRCHG